MSYALTPMGGLLESRQRTVVSHERSSLERVNDGGPSSHTLWLPG